MPIALFLRKWISRIKNKPAYKILAKVKYQAFATIYENLIFNTSPIFTRDPEAGCGQAGCEVHLFTFERHWKMAVWALKSFYYYSGVDWPLTIHECGRLPDSSFRMLQEHFPNSDIIEKKTADVKVEKQLRLMSLDKTAEFRRFNIVSAKFIDSVLLSKSRNIIIMDSDVLFLSNPVELIEEAARERKTNLYNRDRVSIYGVSREYVKDKYGLDLIDRLNTGLCVIGRDNFRWGLFNRFAADQALYNPEWSWCADQTIMALYESAAGCDFLPDSYMVESNRKLKAGSGGELKTKHYAGHIKPNYYIEGLPYLVRRGFLKAINKASA